MYRERKIKTREDLISRIDFFRQTSIEACRNMQLQEMLLYFYMYACGSAAKNLKQEDSMENSVDWNHLLEVIDNAIMTDSIFEGDNLNYLRTAVLLLKDHGFIDEGVSDIFPGHRWSLEQLTGPIHELSLDTIDFYALLNDMGNPQASSVMTLPIVLQIEQVMNEPVFTIPLFAYWWGVYMITLKEKVLRGEYWERDLSDPFVLKSSLDTMQSQLNIANQGYVCVRDWSATMYDATCPWAENLFILKQAQACVAIFM